MTYVGYNAIRFFNRSRSRPYPSQIEREQNGTENCSGTKELQYIEIRKET